MSKINALRTLQEECKEKFEEKKQHAAVFRKSLGMADQEGEDQLE